MIRMHHAAVGVLAALVLALPLQAAPDPQSGQKSKPDMRGMMTGKSDSKDKKKAVHYKNCDEVRKAGKAPLKRGDPGYGRHLDPDGDGVACK